MTDHAQDIAKGTRFAFGENWARFLESLDDARIAEAEASLRTMLGVTTLEGLTFLDIGSGSGLFSLAARRLGAAVTSFDYDPQSVACTAELRRRYFPEDTGWRVEEGSVLDEAYLEALGVFDIVYSWGVLHHTGEMWRAIDNAQKRVAPGGRLFIALYNHQPIASRYWTVIKRLYNSKPWTRPAIIAVHAVYPTFPSWLLRRLRGQTYGRGMSVWRDLFDWVGGYPFETSTPQQVFEFHKDRGFQLDKLVTVGGKLGCNEFVFRKG